MSSKSGKGGGGGGGGYISPHSEAVVEGLLSGGLEEASLGDNPGAALLKGMVLELLKRLRTPAIAAAMSASEMELIRKLCADNSVSLASIRKGDFGETAKRVAEDFPFPDGPQEKVR